MNWQLEQCVSHPAFNLRQLEEAPVDPHNLMLNMDGWRTAGSEDQEIKDEKGGLIILSDTIFKAVHWSKN